MIEIEIPGYGYCTLKYLVLDVNGTIALDGSLIEGVKVRLGDLREKLDIHILTADTHGKQSEIDKELNMIAIRISPQREAEQKADFVSNLDVFHTVAIGNGVNDSLMLETARLGIVVIGHEGAAVRSLIKADIVCTGICDALDLLRNPRRITATLRR